MTVSRIVSIKELPNKQISDTSLFLHNTNDSESKDKNVSVAQVREYLVKPEADRAKKAEADEKARAEKAEADERQERIKAIEEEAKARIDAIAQEAQERITAITAERERAESAEKTEKDERVQAVFEEATERENADTALQSAIDTEAENRESADNALSSRLDDTNEKLDTEISERKADVANIADNLDKENARALEAESALQSAIDTEAETRESANTAMTDKLDAMQETIDAIPFTEDGLKEAIHKEAGDNLLGEVQVLAEKKTISFPANSWTSTGIILPKTTNIALVQIQSFNSDNTGNIWSLNMTALVPLQAGCNDIDYTIVPLPTSTSLHAWNASQSVSAFGIGVQLRNNGDTGIYKSGMHLVLKTPIATTMTLTIKLRRLM